MLIPRWLPALLPLILAGSLSGCYYDVEEELYPGSVCDTADVTYSLTVSPVLSANCTVCHATGSTLGGGVVLDTYAGVKTYADNGKLVAAIKHESSYPMPKNGNKLDDCSISKIDKWVRDGAPNN
jgi:mono/diheme cytochrome c family protein